ncbi:carbohydrate ABC transporter permease [Cellulomonas fimi]|uniref:Binding-protein-dependent transport systems inner membrane component n=1 Tax=Cellulomonas fimi (strain ATCC 484 / DSM 20113 / JCM 1341 / CCUG 24087 / LMG 16345 / NBRC 15513 / NCIMB 8980 / NCTC 7547 / NRS-133) TaxID=590998 RepID=F4GYI0_CELFA|nr:sugar ABC transporter permease [Cellulomonas fimi]AEE47097.1 binding-protein-dependent transport systems inner membrane component [Cellulomonas fimi ATCC 484]NNH07332.1 sugar ABC transporter permease [Cellulomonas fimi]VEH35237.1 sn-glycerol-3-phosphate transport system permease protein ugpA [Cellulomonas fimi]
MKNVLGDRRTAALLLAPALTVYSLIILIPVFWSLGYTLFEGNPITGFSWAGLANFEKLWADEATRDALWFTVRFALVTTIVQVLLGYLLALLYVFVLRRASSLVRTLVFFPVVLPTVAVALLFQQLFEYAPRTGPVNALLNVVGIESIDWFSTGSSAFWVLIIMEAWRSMGFYAVLLYAGLVDIPEETLESARLDGASGARLVRHIVVPLSLPVLFSSLIFSINGTLKVFDSVVALTSGGPGSQTTPLTLYMFQTSFSYGQYGFGSSIALLLTMVCLIVTVGIFRSSRRDLTRG